MGLFLSKYSMLSALGYRDDETIYQETKKLLERFKLFGVVLHDPNYHVEFDWVLKESSERLNYLTGQNFLFFAVTNPPKEWGSQVKRDYFGIWEQFLLLDPRNAYPSPDESMAAYTLAQLLEIDYDDLPVLILTQDFERPDFHVVQTDEQSLATQLTEIGYFCSQAAQINGHIDDSKLNELLDILAVSGLHETKSASGNIAQVFSDYLSSLLGTRSNSHDSGKAKNHLEKVLRHQFARGEGGSNRPERGSLGILANTVPPYLSDRSPFSPLRQSVRPFEDAAMCYEPAEQFSFDLAGSLEPESSIAYMTFKRVEPFFTQIQGAHIEEGHDLDYSTLALALCKVFEIEINHSIVQWVRQHLRIEMPDYYKLRVEDGQEYTLTPDLEWMENPRPIDFNDGRRSKWRAPGIGQSEFAFRTLINRGVSPQGFSEVRGLLSHWYAIRVARNRFAHVETCSANEYQEVRKAFNSLDSDDWFEKLYLLKSSLRQADLPF
jgi:hypothetical protein